MLRLHFVHLFHLSNNNNMRNKQDYCYYGNNGSERLLSYLFLQRLRPACRQQGQKRLHNDYHHSSSHLNNNNCVLIVFFFTFGGAGNTEDDDDDDDMLAFLWNIHYYLII